MRNSVPALDSPATNSPAPNSSATTIHAMLKTTERRIDAISSRFSNSSMSTAKLIITKTISPAHSANPASIQCPASTEGEGPAGR